MHHINRSFLCLTASAALTVGGCANVDGDFPSLAKRPYEKANPIKEVAVVETLTASLSGDLQRQISALLSRSSAAHTAFESSLPSMQSVALSAGNSAPGSESWVNAHTKLSRTDSLRADGVAALGEMDRLVAREREQGADSGLVALLTAPQQQIADRVKAENAEIERLTQLIGL